MKNDISRRDRYRLEKTQGQRTDLTCGQNDHKSERTAEKLSTQYKVSPKTIRRDAEYAEDVNAIADATGAHGIEVVAKTKGKLGRKEMKPLAELAQANPEATNIKPRPRLSHAGAPVALNSQLVDGILVVLQQCWPIHGS